MQEEENKGCKKKAYMLKGKNHTGLKEELLLATYQILCCTHQKFPKIHFRTVIKDGWLSSEKKSRYVLMCFEKWIPE